MPLPEGGSLTPMIGYSAGVCRGRYGVFPTFLARELNAAAPLHTQLANPFPGPNRDTAQAVETPQTAPDNDQSRRSMHAHVSDDDGETSDDGETEAQAPAASVTGPRGRSNNRVPSVLSFQYHRDSRGRLGLHLD